MTSRVQKWGNSLALRIPRSFAEEARVQAGSPVEITVRDGVLMVRPALRGKYTLRGLLKKVTRRNVHNEVSSGPPTGRESW
jgi:antitoxin MazE